MITLVENDGFDWSVEAIQLAEVIVGQDISLVCIAEDEVLDYMGLIVFIVNANVNF